MRWSAWGLAAALALGLVSCREQQRERATEGRGGERPATEPGRPVGTGGAGMEEQDTPLEEERGIGGAGKARAKVDAGAAAPDAGQ